MLLIKEQIHVGTNSIVKVLQLLNLKLIVILLQLDVLTRTRTENVMLKMQHVVLILQLELMMPQKKLTVKGFSILPQLNAL